MASVGEGDRAINIILLGESGVGKSTFINSTINYLTYGTLDEVVEGELIVLIPAMFKMLDRNFDETTIKIGNVTDDNENLADGEAATQNVKPYLLNIEIEGELSKVRLIDTPGMGDHRGLDQDKINCDRILNYLSRLSHIHAFCILLKPTSSRMDIFFNYCLFQILSALDKTAVNNIIFLFTCTRGENFKPGPTLPTLKKFVNELKEKSIELPINRKNVFCFDNESFKYVTARKNGVELEDYERKGAEESWKRSSDEFRRMIAYITELQPHNLKGTLSINEARTMALTLAEPLTKVIKISEETNLKLNQHTSELEKAQLVKESLEKELYIPQFEFSVCNLKSPNVVCSHSDCIEMYEVNGKRKIHYKQICCPSCLSTSELFFCSKFTWRLQCKICHHHMNEHELILYETSVTKNELNKLVLSKMATQEELLIAKNKQMEKLQNYQKSLEDERQRIFELCVVLDEYLKEHSIAPISGPIKDHLMRHMKWDQKYGSSALGINSNNLLNQYQHQESLFRKGIAAEKINITPNDIEERKQAIFGLKQFGSTIKQLYDLYNVVNLKNITKLDTVVPAVFKMIFK